MNHPHQACRHSISVLKKEPGLLFVSVVVCTIVVCVPIGCAQSSDLSQGLLGHWKFDGDVSDSSGMGNNGVTRGDPEFVSGKIGQAVKLAGNGQYAEIGSLASGITQFTIAAWLYVEKMPAPKEFASIYHNNGWNIGDVHLPFAGPEGIMDLGIKGNEPDMSVPSFQVKDLQARWIHLAVSYDADDEGEVRFYLEGQPKDVFDIEKANPVNLGPGRVGAWDEQGRWFHGLIDELYIYKRALENSEVQSLFDLASENR